MDKKITELDALTIAKNEDLLVIVDTENSSLITKKITAEHIRNNFLLPIEISDVTDLQAVLDGKVTQNTIIDGGVF